MNSITFLRSGWGEDAEKYFGLVHHSMLVLPWLSQGCKITLNFGFIPFPRHRVTLPLFSLISRQTIL